jgi:hypothetical protein
MAIEIHTSLHNQQKNKKIYIKGGGIFQKISSLSWLPIGYCILGMTAIENYVGFLPTKPPPCDPNL